MKKLIEGILVTVTAIAISVAVVVGIIWGASQIMVILEATK